MNTRHLPLASVLQRSTTDVELTVIFEDGHREEHYFSSGVSEYLATRYQRPMSESGLRWQVLPEGVTNQ